MIMGADPGDDTLSPGANGPAHNVSWYDAIAFCNRLSMSEGLEPVYEVTVGATSVDWGALDYDDIPTGNNAEWNDVTADWNADGYRLPTEMEWMWVAMGATATAYQRAFAGSGCRWQRERVRLVPLQRGGSIPPGGDAPSQRALRLRHERERP
jgi:formylglycine-generating enzyme required for sulfatase activity